MRIQFSVTPAELSKLQQAAAKEGYPDVPTYCKDVALNDRTYGNIWKEVVAKISKLPSGSVFKLSDITACPPANMGVKLFHSQSTLNIKFSHKDSSNVDHYEKL